MEQITSDYENKENLGLSLITEYPANHPASRAFLLLARFWRSRERLCMNRVRSLLNMLCMLPGYSLEPKPIMPDPTSSPGPSPLRFSKWRLVWRRPWPKLNSRGTKSPKILEIFITWHFEKDQNKMAAKHRVGSKTPVKERLSLYTRQWWLRSKMKYFYGRFNSGAGLLRCKSTCTKIQKSISIQRCEHL